jgi:spore coat polysaccharide biosynthesis protein SpsF
MGSTRLPGKVLKNFCGVPLIQFQIELLKKFNLGFDIIVATTNRVKDQKIISLCKKIGAITFTGSELDVFDRFKKVIQQYQFENIIRLTADNPLISYRVLMDSIYSHINGKYDLTSTREIMNDGTIKRYVPKGLSIDIINCKSLLSIESNSLNTFEKEHLIPVFYRGLHRVNIIKPSIHYSDELSIDSIQEFNKVQEFTKSLIDNGELFKYLGFEA